MKEKIKNLIKHLLAKFIILNEYNESNLLVRFIGIIFLILGFGYIMGFIHLSSLAIVSFSLSGIIFILSDIAKYMAEEWQTKKALGNKRLNKVRLFILLKYTCLFFGLSLLIGGPYISISFQKEILDIFGTACAFIAIGLTIIKISLDNSRKHMELYESIAKESEMIFNEIETKTREIEQLLIEKEQLQIDLNKFRKSDI